MIANKITPGEGHCGSDMFQDEDNHDDDDDWLGLHCILGAVCWPVDRGVL